MLGKKTLNILIHAAPGGVRETLKVATEACFRQGMSPALLETSTEGGENTDPLKLFDGAGLYIGILEANATEHEVAFATRAYAKALEKKLPRLLYVQAVVTAEPFWEAEDEPVRYRTTAELRAAIVNALSAHHEANLTAFHHVGEIPEPPLVYTAHPYTLLPATSMVGRKTQLDILNEWVTDTSHDVRVLTVVAIGGMGKSAMTWKWYEDIAPQIMKPMAGRMWWSFYESDAYFENFVVRALAYVSKVPEDEVREVTPPERERELLEILDQQPFLIVLDGIERMQIAYARLDAAHMEEDDLDEKTANVVAGAIGMPKDANQTMFSPHRLRKTADPRAGGFLRKLATVRASRVLISTRLYPADLQRPSGHPIPGSHAMFLSGLEDADALALWRAYGCTGDDQELIKIFQTFDNYALVIRTLAGEVARFEPAPGDFAAWRKANPKFNPLKQKKEQVKSHVMSYVLAGLTPAERKTLETIAAFRMPSFFDALVALLVKGKGPEDNPKGEAEQGSALRGLMNQLTGNKSKDALNMGLFDDEAGLDAALAELEARGLIGWDQRPNRYDLHPIVRGVAWNALDEKARQGYYAKLNAHFGALPPISVEDVKSLDDLTAPIELFNTLVGMEQYDEACALFFERLNTPMLRRLSANRQRVELLEQLFPDTVERPPKVSKRTIQARVLNALAVAYHASGEPGRAAPLYLRATTLAEHENQPQNVSIGLTNLSDTLRVSGNLRTAEIVANRALLVDRAQANRGGEAASLITLGMARLIGGAADIANAAFQRAMRIVTSQNDRQMQGVCYAAFASRALYMEDYAAAMDFADRAWDLADHLKYETDYVRALRLRGSARVGLADSEDGVNGTLLMEAETLLNEALTRARAVNLTEFELAALVSLAEVQLLRDNERGVRNLLDDIWEPADRGPYRLLHTDAYNLLARLEMDLEQYDAARQVIRTALYLGWCDGTPYHYHWGMRTAKDLAKQLQVAEPIDLPAYDAAKFGQFLPADIDIADEFGASSS